MYKSHLYIPQISQDLPEKSDQNWVRHSTSQQGFSFWQETNHFSLPAEQFISFCLPPW
jgi:hypothetical protein